MRILSTHPVGQVSTNNFVSKTGMYFSKSLAQDTFVSNNSKISFKGMQTDEYDRYCRKFKNFSSLIPGEIYEKLDEMYDESMFIQEKIDRWEDIKIDEDKGIRFGFQNGKLRAAMKYKMMDTRCAGRQWLPESITMLNTDTGKPEKLLEYGVRIYMHSEDPSLCSRTDYYDDGESPKMEIRWTNQGVPVPWSNYMVTEFGTDGKIEKKYFIKTGLSPQAKVEHYDADGEKVFSAEYSMPPEPID